MDKIKYPFINGIEIKPYDIFDFDNTDRLSIQRIDILKEWYGLEKLECVHYEIVECESVLEVKKALKEGKLVQLVSNELAAELAKIDGIQTKWSEDEMEHIIKIERKNGVKVRGKTLNQEYAEEIIHMGYDFYNDNEIYIIDKNDTGEIEIFNDNGEHIFFDIVEEKFYKELKIRKNSKGENVMKEDKEKLKNKLYLKAGKEYIVFLENIKKLDPEDIIQKSYEITIKSELLNIIQFENDYGNYDKFSLEVLNTLDCPLDLLYREWLKNDYSMIDELKDTIVEAIEKYSDIIEEDDYEDELGM